VDRKRSSGWAGRFLKRWWRFTARLDITAIFIAGAAIAVAIGSLFPGPPDVTLSGGPAWQEWQAIAADRYGFVVDLLLGTGVLPYTPYLFFGVPLAFLAIVTLFCTLERWSRIWRRTFDRIEDHSEARIPENPIPNPGSELLCPISPSAADDFLPVVRKAVEQRGYHIQANNLTRGILFSARRNSFAGLGTLATHLGVVVLSIGALATSALGWQEEVVLDPGAAALVGHAPAYVISNQGLEFQRYADGSVSSYLAHVGVQKSNLSDTGVSATLVRTIELNNPLYLHKLSLHLVGFQSTPQGNQIRFKAVHDPGYGLVVAGGFVLLGALAVTLIFPPCSIKARAGQNGQILLYGKSSRYAHAFRVEFWQIVRECDPGCKNSSQGDPQC
jgi:hypothetical protein